MDAESEPSCVRPVCEMPRTRPATGRGGGEEERELDTELDC